VVADAALLAMVALSLVVMLCGVIVTSITVLYCAYLLAELCATVYALWTGSAYVAIGRRRYRRKKG
jgi:hypothetical protein